MSREEKFENAKSNLKPKESHDEFSDTDYHVHGEIHNGSYMIEQEFELHDGKKVTCLYSTYAAYNNRGGFGMSCDWEGATSKEEEQEEDK